MTEQMLRQYTVLVEYLGKTLGPDYEVVLHEILPEKQPRGGHRQRLHQRAERRRAHHERRAAHDHAEAV
ncbi:MAG: hypothetical protein V8S99_07675 [Oscillospiraceae bacterium]